MEWRLLRLRWPLLKLVVRGLACREVCSHSGQACFNQPGEEPCTGGQDCVIEDESWIMQWNVTTMSQPAISTRHSAEHVGEVLAAHHRFRRCQDLVLSDHRTGDLSQRKSMLLAVLKHGEDITDLGIKGYGCSCRDCSTFASWREAAGAALVG